MKNAKINITDKEWLAFKSKCVAEGISVQECLALLVKFYIANKKDCVINFTAINEENACEAYALNTFIRIANDNNVEEVF